MITHWYVLDKRLNSTFAVFLVGAISLMMLLGYAQFASAEELVDTQEKAVATNLGLFGGLPTDIEVDPTGDGQIVYVTTYTPNGIFTSQDAGVTWEGLPSSVDYGAGKAVVVDATTGAVYVAIGDDVLTSTDQGTTWTALTENLVSNPIVGSEITLVNDTLLLAVDSGAVQISEDNGQTFTEVVVSEGTNNNIISMAGTTTGRVYAVVQDTGTETTSLFVSNDVGASWAELDVEAAGVAVGSVFYSVVVDPLDDNHVILGSYHPDYDSYHTFNAGTSWSVLQNAGNRIGGEKAVFDGVGGLYVGINYTNNAGVVSPTWSEITTDTPLSSVRGDLYAVDATHPTTLYSDTAMGVAKSENGGTSWVDSIEGITAAQTYVISQANDKDVVWLGVNGGLAKTTNFTDDTVDWEYPISPSGVAASVYAVWVKPSDADYVVAGENNFLYYTEDGGDTWTQADAPDFTGTVDRIVRSATNNDTLYVMYVNTSLTEDAYNGGVLKSTDFGQTWEEMDFPVTLADGGIAVANQDGEDVVYVGVGLGGDESAVYRFRNGEWRDLEVDFDEFFVNALFVHPDDSNVIFASLAAASTEGNLYKSTDGGDTWKEITDGLGNANHLSVMAVQPDQTSTLYMAGQDGSSGTGNGAIYKSTDNGESWSIFYRGKVQEFVYTLLFDGLVVGNDRGVYDLKSLGKVSLKKTSNDNRHRFTVTLKDAATQKKLVKRKITVYRKNSGKSWSVIANKKTNSKGIVRIARTAKKGTKFKVVWKPSRADRAEYTRSISRVITIN